MELLKKALLSRRDLGIRRYGEPLTTHNGRDARVDMAQELLDLMNYAHQKALETVSAKRVDVIEDLVARLDSDQGLVNTRWWRMVQELVPMATEILEELEKDGVEIVDQKRPGSAEDTTLMRRALNLLRGSIEDAVARFGIADSDVADLENIDRLLRDLD